MNCLRIASIRRLLIALLAVSLVAIANRGCTNNNKNNNSTTAPAANPQQTFDSAEAAAQAVITASRSNDHAQLSQIFGPDSEDLLSSGDAIADQDTLTRFLQSYDEKHQLVTNADGSVTMVVGNNDWPMPIPIVKGDDGKWSFDTDAGKNEIINRRVGRNELTVIEVCEAVCDAQREYAQRDPNGDGVPEYARKLISTPGTKDGLYWATKEGEQPSPLGELAAKAQAEGYGGKPNPNDEPRPYHGYFYRVLTAQGKDAPGGAMDYVINGKLIGGYAIVAWPADYGNSGIMTFVANYTGDVYQKDLGDDTDKLARAMTEYNPDSSWKKQENTSPTTDASPTTGATATDATAN